MKTGNKIGILTLASLGLAAAVFVQSPATAAHHEKGEAQEKGKHHAHMKAKFEEHLKEVDTNGDGVVTKDEADAAHLAHFAESDADSDGAISYEEYEAKAMERAREHFKKMFSHVDKDNDGQLSAEEFSSQGAGRFEKMDANSDGQVTKEEMKAHHKPDGHMGHH